MPTPLPLPCHSRSAISSLTSTCPFQRLDGKMWLLQRDLLSNVSDYHLQCTRQRDEEIQEFTSEKKHLQVEIAAVHHALSSSLPHPVSATPRQVQPAASSSAQTSSTDRTPSQHHPSSRSSTDKVEDKMQEVCCPFCHEHPHAPERPSCWHSKSEASHHAADLPKALEVVPRCALMVCPSWP